MTMPTWPRELWDRVVASDPGLSRLRQALGGAVSMASALAVEFGAARLAGLGPLKTLLAMMMGGMVAMMGSMALPGIGPGVWLKVRTAIFFPVAFGTGITAGILAHRNEDVMLIVFVLMTAAAVFVRRFGMAFFFYGFMGWIGYLFASLLGATFDVLPTVLVALAIGSAWVLLLALTVLRTNPARTLQRTVHAFHARVRTVVAVSAGLADVDLDDDDELRRWRTRLHRQERRLSEAALMIEASSGERDAVPDRTAGLRLRRYALQDQLAVEALAGSIEAIALTDTVQAPQAARVAELLARRDFRGALRIADDLQRSVRLAPASEGTDWWPYYRLVEATSDFADLATRVGIPQALGSAIDPGGATPPGDAVPSTDTTAAHDAARATDAARPDDHFEPAVALMMGNLPSPMSLARDVPFRGPRWLLDKLSMTTRQAIQVGVASAAAILVGRALSGHRYYWALIAVFVTFTGTSTRAESVRKALFRLVGTLTGLAAAMLLAGLTAGHTMLILAVIIASLFCGFYLMRISYAFMIFFITIMVGQLYSVLGEYSPGLLVLRLEETAIGAGIGIIVALVFLPLSTHDTVRSARNSVLETLARVLRAIADRIDEPGDDRPGPATDHHDDEHAATLGEQRTGSGTSVDGDDVIPTDDDAPAVTLETADPEQLARELDNEVRQLAMVATPFSRPAMWGDHGRHNRYLLTRFAVIATQVRSMIVSLQRLAEIHEPALAEVCRSLAARASGLADNPVSRVAGADSAPGHRVPDRVRSWQPEADPPRHYALTRALIRISDLLDEINGTAGSEPQGRPDRLGRMD